MTRTWKTVAFAAALLAVTTTLPGCIFAVGGSSDGSEKRMRKLEHRIQKAEEKLGIPSEGAQK